MSCLDIYTKNVLFASPATAAQSEAQVMACLGPPQRGSVRKVDGSCRESSVPSHLVRSAAFRGSDTQVKIADFGNGKELLPQTPPAAL